MERKEGSWMIDEEIMRWREKMEAGGQMKRGSNEMERKDGSWRIDEEVMR